MQDLRIAIIQTRQFWEDKEKNLQYFKETFLEKLAEAKPDLVLLPEMFNTGFSMNAEELAEEMDGNSIRWLIDQAKALKCQVGASLIIHDNGNYFNRFVVVSEKGVETHYDKRHLFRMADEHLTFTAGSNRIIHQINGWNILLQVCYDLRFPVFSRNKVIDGQKEYDAVIYIANWPEKRAFIWKNLIQARAIENQAYSVGVNRVGEDGKGITYSGDSMVVDPWGNITEKFDGGEEMYRIITLERDILEHIYKAFPAFLDADSVTIF